MMSNLCTPWGALPKKNLEGKIFSQLGSGGVVQTFPGNSPWKEVPKTGVKILGAPAKKFGGGVKISPNFAIFRLFATFSKTVRDIAKLKTDM